jgi:hypothetical protein
VLTGTGLRDVLMTAMVNLYVLYVLGCGIRLMTSVTGLLLVVVGVGIALLMGVSVSQQTALMVAMSVLEHNARIVGLQLVVVLVGVAHVGEEAALQRTPDTRRLMVTWLLVGDVCMRLMWPLNGNSFLVKRTNRTMTTT